MNLFKNNYNSIVTEESIKEKEKLIANKQKEIHLKQKDAMLDNQLKQLGNGGGFKLDKDRVKKYAIGIVVGLALLLIVIKVVAKFI